jgi:AbrB family looped-hinge helix DNA binding protein
VVIPRAVRDKLQLRAGDPLETHIEGDRIVLVPTKKRSRKAKIARDPVTSLPVLSIGRDAPPVTSKQVAEILAEFP